MSRGSGKGETPQIATVRAVVEVLKARGFTPGVMFDANVGSKIGTGYKRDGDLARMLKMPADHVFVVPRGTPADPCLLSAARDLGARVVTNDRFREWGEQHPEIRTPGFLIRGGFGSNGALWLDEIAAAQVAGVQG